MVRYQLRYFSMLLSSLEKRLQRYGFFLIYPNFLQKKSAFVGKNLYFSQKSIIFAPAKRKIMRKLLLLAEEGERKLIQEVGARLDIVSQLAEYEVMMPGAGWRDTDCTSMPKSCCRA